MNERIDDLMYESGLTAQGCWDSMDKYDQEAIMNFGQLIVTHCLHNMENCDGDLEFAIWKTKQDFEVKE